MLLIDIIVPAVKEEIPFSYIGRASELLAGDRGSRKISFISL